MPPTADPDVDDARTPVAAVLDAVALLDPARRYRLHDRVALRDEPFGALAYHYGNRKLVFLKNRRIVDVVRSLEASASVDAALAAHGVPESARANYLGALSSLLRSDMLVEV